MLARSHLFRRFAFAVNSRSVIAPSRGTTPILSRSELQRRIEDPTYTRDQEIIKEKDNQVKIDQYHVQMKSNDTNPANFLTNLKVVSLTEEQKQPFYPTGSVPEIIKYVKERKWPSVTSSLGRVKGSVKRISPLMKKVIGLQIDDAIRVASEMQQQAGKRIHTGLKMIRDNALGVKMNNLRLYVKYAITGRTHRVKGVRYHAKGKSGKQKSDWCTLYFKLEEKPARDFFLDVVSGKAPPGVANMWREKILTSPNAFDDIRSYQFILTSRGRQQRREMIKRKAFALQKSLIVGLYLLE